MCLSVNLETFFRTLLLYSTTGKRLFYIQVAEFQPPDTVKNYFTGAFQAFYTRSRSIHSKAFIYLKSQKTVCKGVNLLNEVARCPTGRLVITRLVQTCKLTKKLFHISFFMHFAFIFSEYIITTSSEEALKV